MSFRLVFIGTPQFAVPCLEALLQGPHKVVGVVTHPDQPVGRGRRTQPSAVKRCALDARIPVMARVSVKDPELLASLIALSPDVIVVVAFGQLLPKGLLENPVHGCLNVHPSVLPKYRGAAPIPWAILNGEHTTGVSVIRMGEQLDAGDILMSRTLQIAEDETAQELSERLSRLGAEVLMETLNGLEKGLIRPVSQEEEKATYAPRLRKSDGEIQWQRTAEEISRQIRAMTPWPGSYTHWRGRRLKIHRARALQMGSSGVPGVTVRADRACLWVQTGDGYLEIREMQLEGRPIMAAAAFLRGHGDIVGDTLR